MPKRYCLIVGGGMSYFRPADHLGLEPTSNLSLVGKSDIALAIFTGGEDVSPILYHHEKDHRTHSDIQRDIYEVGAYRKLRAHNIPMLGICRGAQLLAVLAGASLIQDVSGHTTDHYLKVFQHIQGGDGKTVVNDRWLDGPLGAGNVISPEKVTSSHHQMQYPWELPLGDYKVLAASPTPLSTHYNWDGREIAMDEVFDGEGSANILIEPDVVHYPRINALSIQYHPEWMDNDSWGMQYARELTGKLVQGTL